MPQGIVKKLVADRGFGFISGDRGELFFHHSSVEGTTFEDLQEGQNVEYQIDNSGNKGKGPRATNVKVV
jgi:cold shock protein